MIFGFSDISKLDKGVTTRHNFGNLYSRPKNYVELANRIKQGTLHLPPHPDWSGDITNWAADPFQDLNWQFQFHTLRWLNPLRWLALDGDEEASKLWRTIVRSWFDANVPAEKVTGTFAWKDMADGNRAVQIALGAGLLLPEDRWYIQLLNYHLDWLSDSSHIAHRNHALHQHVGLIVVSAALRNEAGLKLAKERMALQFEDSFDEQGSNDEGSVGYHEANLLWWEEAWKRVRVEGLEVPSTVTKRLEAGREVLAHMLLPNGYLPQIGDTRRTFARGGLGPATEFVRTGGRSGAPPQEISLVLDRGYVLSRSGWGESRPLDQESHMLIRFGNDIRSHSHQDRGSVHIYAKGRPWLVDSGFYSYQTDDDFRNYFISRAAHNVARLQNRQYDERSPVVLKRSALHGGVHDFVLEDTGYPSVSLFRRVLYFPEPNFWIVWDESSSPSAIVQTWHCDIGVGARPHDRGFELRSAGRSVDMTWLGHLPALSRHIAKPGDYRGWIATKWKQAEVGTVVTARSKQEDAQQVVLISPSTPEEFGIVRSTLSGSSLTLIVSRGICVWKVTVADESASITTLERKETDAGFGDI